MTKRRTVAVHRSRAFCRPLEAVLIRDREEVMVLVVDHSSWNRRSSTARAPEERRHRVSSSAAVPDESDLASNICGGSQADFSQRSATEETYRDLH